MVSLEEFVLIFMALPAHCKRLLSIGLITLIDLL